MTPLKSTLTSFLTSILCFNYLFAIGVGVEPKLPNANSWNEQSKSSMQFRENKGQVRDQNGWPRPDVLYSGNAGELYLHFKNNGISYQMLRVDTWKEEDVVRPGLDKEARQVPDLMSVYRTDLYFEGANSEVRIEPDAPLDGYSNFYNVPEGMEPALEVRDYSSLWYRELYAGIDLHYYGKEEILKYDYHISPGADWRQIRIRVEGATPSLLPDGTLILDTPWGPIEEDAPIAYQNSDPVEVQWVVQGNILSFQVGNYDPSQELVIDPPVRLWGTYYGGAGGEYSESCEVDAWGNVHVAGYTNSVNSISSIGAFQTQFGGGNFDAFLVKFSGQGLRLWATYYGGGGDDYGLSCDVDALGNIYMAGFTYSINSISSPGAFQQWHQGGGTDAFLVKFNGNGFRLWGTYYGGPGADYGFSCAVDAIGNVHLAGDTNSFLSVTWIGAFQGQYGGGNADAFLVKFNGNGSGLWGTYYGGAGDDYGVSCAVDALGNVYLAGYTSSLNAIASVGAFQTQYGGGEHDAFLVKFTSNGSGLWGTYYGGVGADYGISCAVDALSNVYLAGYTSSLNAIASVGAFQPQYGGGEHDGFLVKFNGGGAGLWGTYFGGYGEDGANFCSTDATGCVYVVGSTNSPNSIATTGAFQLQYGGGVYDAFITKYNDNGMRLWSSYYGGSGTDFGASCAADEGDHVYVTGGSGSTNGIGTFGVHQTQNFGGFDAYLVKFDGGVVSTTNTPAINYTATILPNPGTGSQLTFTIAGLEDLKTHQIQVQLFDLNGKLILRDKISAPGTQVNSEINIPKPLPSGSYWVQFQVNGHQLPTQPWIIL